MNIGPEGGMLPAPGWWPTRQPRDGKPHFVRKRGMWFEVRDRRVSWISVGGTTTFRKPRTR